MILEVLHDVLLLSELSIKELRVALELVGEALVRCVQELGLVCDSLQESIIDLILNVVGVVAGLLSLIVIEELLDFLLQFVLFLVEVLYDGIVLLLLFVINGF
jgi:hypothetical protein